MTIVNRNSQRSTMSARGRKLTALTPREANSRKNMISVLNAEMAKAVGRKLNAVKDLQ